MGFFGTLKDILNIATGGQVTLLEKQIQLGGKIVNVAIDVSNGVVRIGDEIFRAAPGEVFFPGLGPLAGLLKNESEDELIMLNPLGLVPSITVFIDGALAIGSLIGVVQHRTMRDDELRVVRHVFGNSLQRSNEIRLTNVAGLSGRPFTVPSHAGGAVVNLGRDYVHGDRISSMSLLIHELTHAWQIQRSLAPEVFLCNAALVQIANELGERVYDYVAGKQWSSYGLEQQAHIIEDWFHDPPPMRLASPLFRYVNGNIRTGDNDARTMLSGSIRTRLAEANVTPGSLRKIYLPPPHAWWL